jgi:predicted PurR-regulated permease PerM
MNIPQSDLDFEKRMSSRLLDLLIRTGLIVTLVVLCYQIFAPFLTLMAWAVILAVALYPLHQWLARKLRGKQGLAATILVLFGGLIIVTPTIMLMDSLGNAIQDLVTGVQHNTLEVPAPRPSVENWPMIGEKVYEMWSKAHSDLPAFVQSMQPKIGDLTKQALAAVAGIGVQMLMFLVAFIIAGVLMAFGDSGKQSSRAIFDRVFGSSSRGERFATLATATIRAVGQGVIGIAFIQGIIIGIALLIAGVPLAGLLAIITLLIGIVQLPALLVTLPAIGYLWWSGDYSTGSASAYTVMLLIAGMADNVLKPLMLGRGVDAPMPVILFGALGGMAARGIVGMFVGATLLALGYQIFMLWVAADLSPDSAPTENDPKPVG